MNAHRFPERDIDRLFAGHLPADGDLARLAPLVAALRRDAEAAAPSPERADAMAVALAAEARTDAALALRGKARKVGAHARVGRRRLVTIPLIAAVAVLGVGGTAIAADSAAPGDPLYGIDQALERVGIGDGGTGERLREARRMADRGNSDAALDHAARALNAEGQEAGAAALEEAAVAVSDQGAAQSTEVRTAVSDMLDWMAAEETRGRDFGQGVSDKAHEIRDKANKGGGTKADGPADDPEPTDPDPGDGGAPPDGNNGNGNGRDGRDNKDRKNDR